MNQTNVLSALTIAGSDSGGGAGIQADLKTFAAHRVHGLSAIAALTAQHTRGVMAVHVPDTGFLQAQIDACFDDFSIGAVKLGMLANAAVGETVAAAIERHSPTHVVLDPVMVATSGARLLEADALVVLRSRLIPLCTVLTPNLPEAELLLDRKIADREAMLTACQDLLRLGAQAVLLKGGHLEDSGSEVFDIFADHNGLHTIFHPRLAGSAHGTGCTLASAIAANLCLHPGLQAACVNATDYVHQALHAGYSPGRGDVRVLDHFHALNGGR